MRVVFVCLLSLWFLPSVYTQVTLKRELDKKCLKQYKKAIALSNGGKHKKALQTLDRIIKKYPTFAEAYLKKSGIHYTQKKYKAAITQIDKVIAIDPEHDPEMYFSKAILYRHLDQHNEAVKALKKYLTKDIKAKRKKKAVYYLEQSKFIDYAMRHPVPFLPKKLQGDVNTNALEYIPTLTIDGRQLIFTRRVNGQEDLYIATKKDSMFVDAQPLSKLNTPLNEGVHTISADGKRIIFTGCQRKLQSVGGCDLYTSTVGKDGWSKPINLGYVINSTAWDAQPSLSADGQRLFWSSSRTGGQGGNDIWTSTRTDTTGWHKPVPLSKSINTPYNEESPFIHPDGKTLYFRSDRPQGMGGYDIFYSRYDDHTGQWSSAENIGYPINTKNNEGALSVSLDGTTAFFAADQQQDNKMKNLDIFTFELPQKARPQPTTFVRATIKDQNSGKLLPATIEIVDINNKEHKTLAIANKGVYLGRLLAGYEYAFFVQSDGYIYRSEHFNLSEVKSSYDPYEITIKLIKIVDLPTKKEETPTKSIVMKNIFFATGSAELNPQSNAEIDRLYENLMENPKLRVEIGGHTDNVGSAASNQKLSEQRAKAVVDRLIQNGIVPNRLTYRGYGDTVPIDTNDTDTGRQNNRRTEFKILK